jgi:hypothetical protein
MGSYRRIGFSDASLNLVGSNATSRELGHQSNGPRASKLTRPSWSDRQPARVDFAKSERPGRNVLDMPPQDPHSDIPSENGASLLAPHFASIAQHDVSQRFRVTETAVRDYIRATRFAPLADRLPDLPDGLLVTAAGSVFIAVTTAYSQPGKVARPPD